MRRGFLLISLVLMTAVAAAEEPLRRPTLEALLEDKALELESLKNLMWLPDGKALHLLDLEGRHEQPLAPIRRDRRTGPGRRLGESSGRAGCATPRLAPAEPR